MRVISVADTNPARVRFSPARNTNSERERQREVYSPMWQQMPDGTGPSLLPEMPMLGWSRWERTQVQGLEPHQHTLHEICLIADGQVRWWADDASGHEEQTLRTGHVWVTAPGEQHGGVDTMMHPCELFWLLVDFTQLGPAGGEIMQAFARPGQRAFLSSPDVRLAFEHLLSEHCTHRALGALAARAALLALLVAVARDRVIHSPPALLSYSIAQSLDWMRARLSLPFTIEDVAIAVGITPSHFHERFLQEVGQTPGEWRTRERIACAQEQLRTTTQTITKIAWGLGFRSSQHFATAFKRYTGHTPTGYRARLECGLTG